MAKALPVFAVNPNGPLTENAPLMLHTRLEEMYHFAPLISDPNRVEELHNMRIAAKRLRYTMEIFAPCFGEKAFSKIYNNVKSIQEQIGNIHDADVRVPLLQAFVEKHADDFPEIRVGLESLIRDELQNRERIYREFLVYWNKLQTKQFKRQFLQMLVTLGALDTEESKNNDDENS
jgi:hypothetical protein